MHHFRSPEVVLEGMVRQSFLSLLGMSICWVPAICQFLQDVVEPKFKLNSGPFQSWGSSMWELLYFFLFLWNTQHLRNRISESQVDKCTLWFSQSQAKQLGLEVHRGWEPGVRDLGPFVWSSKLRSTAQPADPASCGSEMNMGRGKLRCLLSCCVNKSTEISHDCGDAIPPHSVFLGGFE